MPPPPPAPASRSLAERQLTVLYETARVLADSATYAEAVPRILGAVGDALGWEYGALWDVDSRAGVLRCAATWSAAPAAFESFAATSLDRTFSPGEGLPGRVWATGTPAWIPDVLSDPNFPRAPMAARDGLRSALGFPLVVGSTMRGVIEFFSQQIQEPDAALLELFAAVGRQMGVFMSRKAAQDDLDRFFTLSLDMLCIARTDGYFIRVNPQWTRVTGYTEGELLAAAVSGFRACRGSEVDDRGRRAPGGGRTRGLVREPVSVQGRHVSLADVDVRAVSRTGTHLRVGARHHGPAAGRRGAAPLRQRDGGGATGPGRKRDAPEPAGLGARGRTASGRGCHRGQGRVPRQHEP